MKHEMYGKTQNSYEKKNTKMKTVVLISCWTDHHAK